MMTQGMSSTVTQRRARTRMNLSFPTFRAASRGGAGYSGTARTGLQGGIRAALSRNPAAFLKGQQQPDGE